MNRNYSGITKKLPNSRRKSARIQNKEEEIRTAFYNDVLKMLDEDLKAEEEKKNAYYKYLFNPKTQDKDLSAYDLSIKKRIQLMYFHYFVFPLYEGHHPLYDGKKPLPSNVRNAIRDDYYIPHFQDETLYNDNTGIGDDLPSTVLDNIPVQDIIDMDPEHWANERKKEEMYAEQNAEQNAEDLRRMPEQFNNMSLDVSQPSGGKKKIYKTRKARKIKKKSYKKNKKKNLTKKIKKKSYKKNKKYKYKKRKQTIKKI